MARVHVRRTGTSATVDRMSGRKAPADSDDFTGIGRGGAAVVLVVAALASPWQALRELLAAIRRLAGRAGRLVLAPFGLLAAIVVARRTDRRPTFDDYLRRGSDGDA